MDLIALVRGVNEVKYPLPSDLIECGNFLIVSMQYCGFIFPCLETP